MPLLPGRRGDASCGCATGLAAPPLEPPCYVPALPSARPPGVLNTLLLRPAHAPGCRERERAQREQREQQEEAAEAMAEEMAALRLENSQLAYAATLMEKTLEVRWCQALCMWVCCAGAGGPGLAAGSGGLGSTRAPGRPPLPRPATLAPPSLPMRHSSGKRCWRWRRRCTSRRACCPQRQPPRCPATTRRWRRHTHALWRLQSSCRRSMMWKHSPHSLRGSCPLAAALERQRLAAPTPPGARAASAIRRICRTRARCPTRVACALST